jgi:hypothetical protein
MAFARPAALASLLYAQHRDLLHSDNKKGSISSELDLPTSQFPSNPILAWRHQAQSLGGKSRKKRGLYPPPSFDFSDPHQIPLAMSQLAELVYFGVLPPKRAETIGRLSSWALHGLDAGEFAEDLAHLKRLAEAETAVPANGTVTEESQAAEEAIAWRRRVVDLAQKIQQGAEELKAKGALHDATLDSALVASLFTRMRRDIDSRFSPAQACREWARAVKHVFLLIRLHADAICPLLHAAAECAQLLNSTWVHMDLQPGSPDRLARLVDAHNRVLARVAVLEMVDLKYFGVAAVPRYLRDTLLGLDYQLLLTCRYLSASGLDDLGLDYEALVSQAQTEVSSLVSSARARGEMDLSEIARSIRDKEMTLWVQLTDLTGTMVMVFANFEQQVEKLEPSREHRRQRRKPTANCSRGPVSKSSSRSRRRSKPRSRASAPKK